ncbi:hypothetical protein WN944_021427 [Citrus x changshan-huyou]|uniref:Uncharacterized protein n=1 Tax=Citrus x changshan-huyou TaxID=2935761 RepID=A0AAP0MZ88_9ROSI
MFYPMSNARLTPVIDVVRLKKDGISQVISALVGLNSIVPQYSVIPNCDFPAGDCRDKFDCIVAIPTYSQVLHHKYRFPITS